MLGRSPIRPIEGHPECFFYEYQGDERCTGFMSGLLCHDKDDENGKPIGDVYCVKCWQQMVLSQPSLEGKAVCFYQGPPPNLR